MIWPEITAVIVLGLGGSFGHCVGMCGGFALAVGRNTSRPGALVVRHLAYQSGKALTYTFLAVLLTAGVNLLGRAGWFPTGQFILTCLAGAVMILYGAMQVAEWRPGAAWARVLEPFPGCRALATVASRPGWVFAFGTGWLNGFLPCGLVMAALAQLASTGSVPGAALGAVLFGAATFPGLFLFGLVAGAWSPRRRRWLVRGTGAVLVVFGLLTLVRAFPEGRHWLHQEIIPGVWGNVREWCGF